MVSEHRLWKSTGLYLNPLSTAYKLYDLEQVTYALSPSSLIVKLG